MSATAITFGTKATPSAQTLASGELLLSGYLTRWGETDLEAESFVKGSVTPATIRKFLSTHAPLCYSHSLRDVVGRVLDLKSDDVGLKMVAKIARPDSLPAHLKWIREAVKDKLIGGLSMGAVFRRSGNKIVHADLVEASLTASPVLPSTSLEVISEGKAMQFGWPRSDAALRERALRELDLAMLRTDIDLLGLQARG